MAVLISIAIFLALCIVAHVEGEWSRHRERVQAWKAAEIEAANRPVLLALVDGGASEVETQRVA